MTTDPGTTPTTQYFTYVSGTEYGPYTLDQLTQFVGTGNITQNSHVRADGGEWVLASAMPELSGTFGQLAPAAPAYGYAQPGYGQPGVPALPQGVELAPVGRRIGAWFLSIPLAIVTLGIGYLIWGLIVWGKGTSPALQVLGMKVVKADTGLPATWGEMALRNIVGNWLLGAVTFNIASVVSFVMFLTDDQRRSLPDRIASTLVVHDPEKRLG